MIFQRGSQFNSIAGVGLYLMAGTLLCSTFTYRAAAADITNLIVRETQLDEQISQACSSHCLGNRRDGRLDRFLLERIPDSNSFLARTEVSLRNYHYVDPPTVLGRRVGNGFAMYDYTILAVAEGILNGDSCVLEIINIQLENDRLGLSSIASSQIGKKYPVDRCERFIESLR